MLTQYPDGPASSRRTQIDGLRAIAMLGVLYVHTWNDKPLFEWIRVSLFFIVSGFLITSILLEARDQAGRVKVWNFYIRRSLRLVPALLILVAFGLIFNPDKFRDSAVWHIMQVSNFWFARVGDFQPGIVAHLWSLNLLEQFYLIWPPVILLLPMKGVYLVTLGVFVSMSVLRVHLFSLGLSGMWELIFAADPVAVGAFFCLLMRVPAVSAVILSRGLLFTSLIVILSPVTFGSTWAQSESYRLLIQPALGILVCGAYKGWQGPVGTVLGSAPAQFLSRISYGVFIYHTAVWWSFGMNWPFFWGRGPVTFFVVTAASILVAWLSWSWLERPISKMKRFVPVVDPQLSAEPRKKRLVTEL